MFSPTQESTVGAVMLVSVGAGGALALGIDGTSSDRVFDTRVVPKAMLLSPRGYALPPLSGAKYTIIWSSGDENGLSPTQLKGIAPPLGGVYAISIWRLRDYPVENKSVEVWCSVIIQGDNIVLPGVFGFHRKAPVTGRACDCPAQIPAAS